MDALPSTSEIIELVEQHSEIRVHEKAGKNIVSRSGGNRFAIDNEINQLLETINLRTSIIGSSPCSSHDVSRESLRRSAMKRPIRVSSAQASGIGITEPVNMKQALRGFCISHASEMAAMKRLSQPTASPGASDARTIKRLYKSVVAEAEGSGIPHTEVGRNVVEVSFVPEKVSSDCSAKVSEDSTGLTSTPFADAAEQTKVKANTHAECQNAPLSAKQHEEISMVEDRTLKSRALSLRTNDQKTESGGDTSSNAVINIPTSSTTPDEGLKGEYHVDASQSGLSTAFRMNKLPIKSTFLMKPVFKNKSFNKKKAKQDSRAVSSYSASCTGKIGDGSIHPTINVDSLVQKCGFWDVTKGNESTSPDLSSNKISIEVNSSAVDTHSGKVHFNASCGSGSKSVEAEEKSSSRGKWEFSQSSKSSIGDYSCSTSISEESYSSGSSRSGNRHHMSKDHLKKTIRSFQMQYGTSSLTHFKLVRRLGCGDIGTVYLAELTGTNCLFALKVMDIEFLVRRNKLHRAQTEREILQMLDHPFLPTLYAHFSTDKLSCLVMEYCPGGDLHVLRQKKPSNGFSEQVARFYVAEVLLALEYLHMLGVVYRDLKPENILVREDGHIMLTDFDLSLRCVANPVLVKSSSPAAEPAKEVSSSCTEANCINPSCLDPSWQVSCFNSRLTKSRKMKCDLAAQISPLPELIVEPTTARSNSFVGTYEYLAPEIIKGEGHGSAVDWWTFGIFLFELLYGKTPFKGSGNEETLANVVSQNLRFPSTPIVSFYARDLIRGLLIKEPENRLGSAKGATEIKQHPFFEGLNWPLIRCARPPELPNLLAIGISATSQKNESIKCEEFKSIDEDTEFEMF